MTLAHSTFQKIWTLADSVWIPRWHDWFVRPDGLFHEQVDLDGRPVDTGQLRLVSQTRQIFTYTAATDCNERYGATLERAFDALLQRFRGDNPLGGFAYALNVDGSVKEPWFDFYGHAFALYSCVQYFRASGDPRARDAARSVLDLLTTRFRVDGLPGLTEALGADGTPLAGKVRRQNPHMHLLEACLFGYQNTNDARYAEVAQEMYGLFDRYFYRDTPDGQGHMLVEFFSDDLTAIDPRDGMKIEGGHHHEWVWLLDRYRSQISDTETVRAQQRALYDTAWRFGFDTQYGGIPDVVDAAAGGAVLSDTKRIWPVTEGIKSVAIATRDGYATPQQQTAMMDLWNLYLPSDGGWEERFARDMRPMGTPRPASTPYHVLGGVIEGLRILQRQRSG